MTPTITTEPNSTTAPSLSTLLAGRRVVVAHDWLTGMRGGESVLESILRLCPSADVVTLVHVRGSVSAAIESRRIRTSFVQHLPFVARHYRSYLPLFPAAVELIDLDDADVVISTSHCAVKSLVRSGRARHVCYCHTPMRYVWDQFDAYFGPARLGRAKSAAMRRVATWLARWDRDTAARVDRFVANSRYVAGRIARYYNRPSTVVHPPVDTAFFTPADGARRDARASDRDAPFVVVSALVPYKRIDVAIRAAAKAGVRLTIIGSGPDEAHLRAIAGPEVSFLGTISPEALREAYRGAQALVLPAAEDFGIAPVESLACGRPVVALNQGGACETVEHGVTGLLVDRPEADAFAQAMIDIPGRHFDPTVLRAHAERFSTERFEAAFAGVLHETLVSDAAW